MENENDELGLDQPLKLGRVLRIPKITDDLLFENNRGLPQVRNNYKKLARLIRKNDHALADKVLKERLSKSGSRQAKVATEVENLQKVLLFYQLWCHGLFPKATFKDCLKMLRSHKSLALREYRKGLIENEIRRLKIEKGIISEDPPNDAENSDGDDLYGPTNADTNAETGTTADASADTVSANQNDNDSDDDDWGFMSTNRRSNNGLFINDDEDDEDTTPLVRPDASATQPQAQPQASQEDEIPPEDDFADLDDFDMPETSKHSQLHENDEDHDEELAIMREMGL